MKAPRQLSFNCRGTVAAPTKGRGVAQREIHIAIRFIDTNFLSVKLQRHMI